MQEYRNTPLNDLSKAITLGLKNASDWDGHRGTRIRGGIVTSVPVAVETAAGPSSIDDTTVPSIVQESLDLVNL